MNVLCISTEGFRSWVKVEVGGVYQVKEMHRFLESDWYEFTHHIEHVYLCENFIPIDPTGEEVKEYSQLELQTA